MKYCNAKRFSITTALITLAVLFIPTRNLPVAAGASEAEEFFQNGRKELALRNYKEATASFQKAYDLKKNTSKYRKYLITSAKELGAKTLAGGDHESALGNFTLAESLLSAKDSKVDFMIWLCKTHKLYRNVTPEYTHRILAVFFKNTDATVMDFNDKPVHIRTNITDDQIKDSETTHALFKMIIEAFTRGRLSIDIKTVFVDDPVTRIGGEKRPAKKRVVYQPVIGYLPGLGGIVADKINDFDTIFYYWASDKLAVRSTGGAGSLSVIPHTLKSQRRGSVILSAKHTHWSSFSGAYLHEFGHVIETFGVGRTHALYPERINETRKLYPDFTGTFEANWWKYLFEEKIPSRIEALGAKAGGLTPPYRNLSFSIRGKDDSLQKKYELCRPFLKDVTVEMLQKARALYDASAKENKKTNAPRAQQLCVEMQGIHDSINRIYETLKMNHCCRVLNPGYKEDGTCK
ncbi:MAG: hypothetical protein KBA61_02170 [Spirochaetes bacterium]|nr:hypothetical protein [Spirochaetota bacterium]